MEITRYRPAFEVAEDEPPPPTELQQVQRMRTLQSLRKSTADAELALARQQHERAIQEALQAQRVLTETESRVRSERSERDARLLEKPTNTKALTQWQGADVAAVELTARRHAELEQANTQQASAAQAVQVSVEKSKKIALRVEKFDAMLDAFNEI